MKSEERYEFKKYILRRVRKYHQGIIFISIRYHPSMPRWLIFDLKFSNETFIETFYITYYVCYTSLLKYLLTFYFLLIF